MTLEEVMRQYEKIYAEKVSDDSIREIKEVIALCQEGLKELESLYDKRLRPLERKIEALVLREQESVQVGHVYAQFSEPRRSTSWKSIAEAMDAPQELIEKNTKVGNPRVSIKWKMD